MKRVTGTLSLNAKEVMDSLSLNAKEITGSTSLTEKEILDSVTTDFETIVGGEFNILEFDNAEFNI